MKLTKKKQRQVFTKCAMKSLVLRSHSFLNTYPLYNPQLTHVSMVVHSSKGVDTITSMPLREEMQRIENFLKCNYKDSK